MNTLAEKMEELLHIEWIVEHIRDYEFYGKTEAIRRDLTERISMKNVYYSILLEDVRQMEEAFDNNPFNYRTDLIDLPGDCVRSAVPDNYFVHWTEGNETYIVPVGFLREHAEAEDMSRLTGKVQQLAAKGRSACRSICSSISSITREAVNEIAEYAVSYRARISGLTRSVFMARILLAAVWYFFLSALLLNRYVRNYLMRFTGSSVSFSGNRNTGSVVGRLLEEPPWLQRFPRFRGGWVEKNLFRIPAEVPLLQIVTAVLAFTAVMLIVISVRTFHRDVMNRRMKQVVQHYDRMKKHYAALEQVRQAVEDPMSDEPIVKISRTNELRELLRLSGIRFSFRYPRGIRPGDYTKACVKLKGPLIGLALLTALVLYLR